MKSQPGARNLANLTSLDLELNELESLPAELINLSNLQVLNVSQNRLTPLPPVLDEFPASTRIISSGQR